MRAAGIKPNVVAYTSLARPLAHKGDWRAVEALGEEMRADGLAMNAYFLYAQLLAYGAARPRQADRAEAAFRQACGRGVEANRHVLQGLARAVGRPRCHQLARDCGVDGQEEAPRPRRRSGKSPVGP